MTFFFNPRNRIKYSSRSIRICKEKDWCWKAKKQSSLLIRFAKQPKNKYYHLLVFSLSKQHWDCQEVQTRPFQWLLNHVEGLLKMIVGRIHKLRILEECLHLLQKRKCFQNLQQWKIINLKLFDFSWGIHMCHGFVQDTWTNNQRWNIIIMTTKKYLF